MIRSVEPPTPTGGFAFQRCTGYSTNILDYIGQDTRVVELTKGLCALSLSFQQIDVLRTVITFFRRPADLNPSTLTG
jgi:hypothetical protein